MDWSTHTEHLLSVTQWMSSEKSLLPQSCPPRNPHRAKSAHHNCLQSKRFTFPYLPHKLQGAGRSAHMSLFWVAYMCVSMPGVFISELSTIMAHSVWFPHFACNCRHLPEFNENQGFSRLTLRPLIAAVSHQTYLDPDRLAQNHPNVFRWQRCTCCSESSDSAVPSFEVVKSTREIEIRPGRVVC
jgi:hypothetical protein